MLFSKLDPNLKGALIGDDIIARVCVFASFCIFFK